MKVIALAQQKGGVSKTTLAIHLAAEAQRQKLRAVIIELDRQGTASFWRDRRGADKDGSKLQPDVMRQEANQLEQTLSVMRNLGVGVVVLDLPGASNPGTVAAIKAADFVLLPSRAQETDIAASAEPLAVVQRLRKPYAYVFTFVGAQPARAVEATEALTAEGHPVAPQFMTLRQVYADAVSTGRTVMEMEPKGKAAAEIAELWKWVSKQLGKSHEHVENDSKLSA